MIPIMIVSYALKTQLQPVNILMSQMLLYAQQKHGNKDATTRLL